MRDTLPQPRRESDIEILVVEDDIAIQEAIKDILEFSGYSVKVASNGQVAMSLLTEPGQKMPCMILLDLMMPVMNGWEFVEKMQLNQKISEIPIVIASANGASHPPPSQLNVKIVLKKPINIHQLLEAAHKFCAPV